MSSSAQPRVTVSIGTKLALALAVLIALLSAAVYVALTRHERSSLLAAKQASAALVLDVLSNAVSAPVVVGDEIGIAETLSFLARNDDVLGAAVYRVDEGAQIGAQLARYERPGARDNERADVTCGGDDCLGMLGSLSFDGDVLRGTYGVHDEQGRLIAVLRAGFSLASEQRTFAMLAERVLLVSVAIALAAMLLTSMLARLYITRPLRALTHASQRLEAGESPRLPDASRDEVGQLARAFGRMASAIAAREQAIAGQNAAMRQVLENVGQGFLTLDPRGAIVGQHSSVVTRWFGPVAPGEKLWELLRPHDPQQAEWLELVWTNLDAGSMPVALCFAQLPTRITAGGRSYDFEYRPTFRNGEEDGQLEGAVLVVSDVTESVAREQREQEQRELVAVLDRLVHDRTGFRAFFEEAAAAVDEVVRSGDAPGAGRALLRSVHTLRGNAALFGMESVVAACAQVEAGAAAEGRIPESAQQALRAAFTRFARLLAPYLDERATLELSEVEHRQLLAAVEEREPYPRLAERLSGLADEPAMRVLTRVGERIEVLARRLHKGRVRVVTTPTTLRLPRPLLGSVSAALVHLAHNAIDHGIEPERERSAAGKPVPATITLLAREHAGRIVLTIADDGRGIDWERVRGRALALGLAADTPADLEAALFADGLTTREVLGEVSGRGVGLAAVKQAVESLGGRIAVRSERGRGTTFEVQLSLASLRAA